MRSKFRAIQPVVRYNSMYCYLYNGPHTSILIGRKIFLEPSKLKYACRGSESR